MAYIMTKIRGAPKRDASKKRLRVSSVRKAFRGVKRKVTMARIMKINKMPALRVAF
jgi:hypothetical protein